MRVVVYVEFIFGFVFDVVFIVEGIVLLGGDVWILNVMVGFVN